MLFGRIQVVGLKRLTSVKRAASIHDPSKQSTKRFHLLAIQRLNLTETTESALVTMTLTSIQQLHDALSTTRDLPNVSCVEVYKQNSTEKYDCS